MVALRYGIFLTTFLAPVLTVYSLAQEFRIETEVFEADKKAPVAESLTLFSGDIVYDFVLGEREEITIFDIQRRRIVLLNPAQKIKAELSFVDLLEFCSAIKTRATGENVEALFSPQFEQSFDEERGLLTLASEQLTYTAKGLATKQPEAAIRFQQFADWYARLNGMRPGNLPPFGRIELNKALAERQLIPQEVTRVVVLDRPVADRKMQARSHHVVTWLISGTDRKRIETAGSYLTNFRQVLLKEYWQLEGLARAR